MTPGLKRCLASSAAQRTSGSSSSEQEINRHVCSRERGMPGSQSSRRAPPERRSAIDAILEPKPQLIVMDHNSSLRPALWPACRRSFQSCTYEHQPDRLPQSNYARPTLTHEHAEQEAGTRFERTTHCTPVLHGALAYLECRLDTAQDAGDHTISIAEVEDVVVRDGNPLLYFRGNYREISVPKS